MLLLARNAYTESILKKILTIHIFFASFTDNIFSRLEATRGPVGILTWTRAPLTSVTRPVWPSP